MQRRVTLSDVISWKPCWDEVKLKEYAEGRTQVDILTLLKDEELKLDERVWLAIYAMDDRERRLFACDCASRALDREEAAGRAVDPRSREAVRVARLYSDGRATIEELIAARDAAWYAASSASRSAAWYAARKAAKSAARSAALDAAWYASCDAAWKASCDVAWDVAWETERRWQLEWIRAEYLGDQD